MEDGTRAGGYVTDVTYAASFFRELAPAWLNYVAALNGAASCDLTSPFSYLELGCGHGHSALVHAAASPHATFHACDLNRAHIAAASTAAAAFQIGNLHFHEASFADLKERSLPQFDFIVLHGVYSWVDGAARQALRDILRTRLRPGGLAYVSYNCLPGWAGEAPLRKLLIELAASEPGDTLQRSERALERLVQLSQGKLHYLAHNPAAGSALAAYQRSSRNYLVHEFMNASWDLFYGVDVADEMQAAGLTYVGSATLADNHPMLLVDEHTAATIAALPNERQQRLAIDYAINQRFRRDVFVRGELTRPPQQIQQQLAAAYIGCTRASDLRRSTIRVPRGELTLQPDFMRELAEVLSDGPVRLERALSALHRSGRDVASIMRNLLFLLAGNVLWPCAAANPAPAARPSRYASETLGLMLAHIASSNSAGFVPSPVLGNGVKLQALEAQAVRMIIEDGADAARVARENGDVELTRTVFADVLPTLTRLGVLL